MGKRRLSRELTLQFLYSCDINLNFTSEDLDSFWILVKDAHHITDENFFSSIVYTFANTIIHGILENLDNIDNIIKTYATNWTFSRITIVDRNLLRMAIYEILYMPDIPPVVSIDEAVDIAKKYSTPDSGKFVNGVLDKVKNEISKNKQI